MKLKDAQSQQIKELTFSHRIGDFSTRQTIEGTLCKIFPYFAHLEDMAVETKKQTWDDIAIKIANRVGVLGSLAIIWSGYFFFFASFEQHKFFIDHFILLRSEGGSPFYPYFILVCYTIIVIAVIAYCVARFRLMQQRIDELAEERTAYQQKLLSSTDIKLGKISRIKSKKD